MAKSIFLLRTHEVPYDCCNSKEIWLLWPPQTLYSSIQIHRHMIKHKTVLKSRKWKRGAPLEHVCERQVTVHAMMEGVYRKSQWNQPYSMEATRKIQ